MFRNTRLAAVSYLDVHFSFFKGKDAPDLKKVVFGLDKRFLCPIDPHLAYDQFMPEVEYQFRSTRDQNQPDFGRAGDKLFYRVDVERNGIMTNVHDRLLSLEPASGTKVLGGSKRGHRYEKKHEQKTHNNGFGKDKKEKLDFRLWK